MHIRQNVVMLNDVMLCHYARCCNPVSRYPECCYAERHGNSKGTQNIHIQPNLTLGFAQTPIFLNFRERTHSTKSHGGHKNRCIFEIIRQYFTNSYYNLAIITWAEGTLSQEQSGTTFTTIHFLRNLRMGPTS
jgi:hypothetical protein